MIQNPTTNIERIIAKIDNDFNPDNSDWIPRVGTWCIDAMSILKCTPTEKRTIKLKVNNRIAATLVPFSENIKVFDKNGCRIKSLDEVKATCACIPSTGRLERTNGSNTVGVHYNPSAQEDTSIAIEDNDPNIGPIRDEEGNVIGYNPARYNVHTINANRQYEEHNYVLGMGGRRIELNFDTDEINVEYESVKTYHSGLCGCELPSIPNNGTLIEALTYYCMYKMLCRGMKHPVFNLSANQYGTNPYFEWNRLKDEAKRSVINDGINQDLSKLWRSAFFISAFDPRR